MAELPINDPNSVPLRTHLEALFEGYMQAHKREHQLLADALETAYKRNDARLEGMNQFRDQLNSQAGAFATKEDMNQRFDAMEDKLLAAIANARTERQAEIGAIEARLTIIERWQNNLTGRLTAAGVGFGILVTFITILLHYVLKF